MTQLIQPNCIEKMTLRQNLITIAFSVFIIWKIAKYVLPNLKKSFFNDLEQFRLLTFILAMYVVEKIYFVPK